MYKWTWPWEKENMAIHTATLGKERGQEYLSQADIANFRVKRNIPDDAEMRYYGSNIWFKWETKEPETIWSVVNPPFPTANWFYIRPNKPNSVSGKEVPMFTAHGYRNACNLATLLNSGALGTFEHIYNGRLTNNH
jgi:hypothetical protein